MIFEKGRTRFVIAFPSLRFAVKLPIMHFMVFYHTAKNIKTYGWGVGLMMWKINYLSPQSPIYQLFGGYIANWYEWWFWFKNKHPLLHPTWLSFLGILNIQKYGKPLTSKYTRLSEVVDKVTAGTSSRCGHGFEIPMNYTDVDGYLRMIDYGSPCIWPIILQYGEQIMKITTAECLDPSLVNETE